MSQTFPRHPANATDLMLANAANLHAICEQCAKLRDGIMVCDVAQGPSPDSVALRFSITHTLPTIVLRKPIVVSEASTVRLVELIEAAMGKTNHGRLEIVRQTSGAKTLETTRVTNSVRSWL